MHIIGGNHLVGSKPYEKTARGRKDARKLTALASIVESEAQLDLILSNDLKLKGNPILRAEVKREILKLNPKLAEAKTDGQ